jgi:uncharacterized LabA/DUF88 family protein
LDEEKPLNIMGERTFAFIDGPNLHATVRALGFEIDYRKLLEHLRKQGHFVRALYYTAIVEDQEYSTFRPLADWLDYNGYTMVTKPARGFTDSTGRRRFRTSMDVELAVDAMRLADKADHIILFSGEQSFASLVAALQQIGKRVTVISTIETQPAMVADELRRQADVFIDIDSMQSQIARLGRPPRPQHSDREDRYQRSSDLDEDGAGMASRSAADAGEPANVTTLEGVEISRGETIRPEVIPPTASLQSSAEANLDGDVRVAADTAPAPTIVKTVRRRRTTAQD